MRTLEGPGRPPRTHLRRVLFLGGNGHCTERLQPARASLAEVGSDLELIDARYPGFEGRPRAGDLDQFLDTITAQAEEVRPALVYATGIGGLLALALRARGELRDLPLVLQGAVLWGLERRTFARIMRGPMPYLLQLALRTPLARARFRSRHLEGVDPSLEEDFFRGYESRRAFPDFFRWLRAPLLRQLEDSLRADPSGLSDVSAWWGSRDHVVGREELEITERALDTRIPLAIFKDWGHYPMLEDPRGWAEELDRVVA